MAEREDLIAKILSSYTVPNDPKLKDWIDEISQFNGYGSLQEIYSQMLRGINHRGIGNPIPTNRDNVGLYFFTRPDLNLSYDNIQNSPTMSPLLTSAPETIQRYVRTTLDPRGAFERGVTSPLLCNHRNPFITVLTNNLISLSGWPDIVLNIHKGEPGIYRETWMKYDGVFDIHYDFPLSMSFRNIAGDPIWCLLLAWLEYGYRVTNDKAMPYPDNNVGNIIDYQTRIYALKLDPGRRYVQKIADCYAAQPSTYPTGAAFNYNGEQNYQTDLETISLQFEAIGARYNNPKSIKSFNDVVAKFNPQLAIVKGSEKDDGSIQIAGNYIKLRNAEVQIGNGYGIPLIHPRSNELMWFVTPDEYEKIKSIELNNSSRGGI